ncbi:hypothetical protein FACS1894102_1630 [Spirochaetia bacterium]|nr:hypothetical protein FACS1894102_1630 [Spirochaetia bacterium]
MACAADKPKIFSLTPPLGEIGSLVTIHGENFGNVQNESYVSIGGVIPTGSSYYSWSDTIIVVQVPDFGESGILFVNCKNQKSNPVLFATTNTIPKITETKYSGPFITGIKNQSAKIGDIITISGNGFGSRQSDGSVLFTMAAENSVFDKLNLAPMISSSEFSGTIESWTGHEISVFVTDGAGSGVVKVQSEGMESNGFNFYVDTSNGKKTSKNKKTYTLDYSVDVSVEKASLPNAIYLWVPQPQTYYAQIKKELLSSNIEAIITDHKGTSLFRLENFKNGATKNITLSYLVDVYEISTVVEQSFLRQTIPQSEFATANFLKKWSEPGKLIPSDKKEIIDISNSIKSDRNPYAKAKAIYKYILDNIKIVNDTSIIKETLMAGKESASTEIEMSSELEKVIREKKATPYTASLLFCALCRSSGLPSLPVSGVLAENDTKTSAHTWAMVWINTIGWIPVDLALGQNAESENKRFVQAEDYGEYYFGNLDNSHITFTIGELKLSQMDISGHTSGNGGEYARQNIWEEAAGTIESYSSLWSSVSITGVYSN